MIIIMILISSSVLCLVFQKLLHDTTTVFSHFAGIGLLYVTASVWQMLRGSLIVFTGIFSVSVVKYYIYLRSSNC